MIADYTQKYPALVFLHAFPLHSGMWKNQLEIQQHYAGPILTIDYPGFGKTPLIPEGFTIDQLSMMIRETLSKFHIDRVILDGCSMGGYVALNFVRQYPEMVKGLILSNTKATADTPETRSIRYKLIDQIQQTGSSLELKKMHIEKFFSQAGLEQNPSLPSIAMSLMQEVTNKGIMDALRAMAERSDSTDVLQSIDYPVCIIHGEHDPFMQETDLSHMESHLQQPVIRIFKESAHLSNLEYPELYNHTIIEYLSLLTYM